MLSPSSGNRQLPTLLTDLLGKLDSLPAEQRQAITAELDSLRACLADEITAGEVQSLLQTIFTFDPGGMEVITFPDLVYQMVNNAYRAMAPDPNVNLLGKSMADDSKFTSFLPLIVSESIDERNFVKKAVNWALRQIGKRNMQLNKTAIETCNEILKINSKSAKWIASDAIRELTNEKILKRIK